MGKTEKQEKLAFTANMGSEPLDKLAAHLKETYGIESRISFRAVPLGSEMYVDKKDYQTAIAMGSLFAAANLENLIAWVNSNNIEQPIGFIPVMYGVLPQTREGNFMWAYFDSPTSLCPEDLKTYINSLKEFCAVDQVSMRYNECDNAFTILASAPFSQHELMQKRCRGFNFVNEHTPFIETYYPNWDNSLDVDFEKVYKKRYDALKSYFNNSLFFDAIIEPTKPSIMPFSSHMAQKNFHYNRNGWVVLKKEILSDNELYIKGGFSAFASKDDRALSYSKILDKGDFSSQMSFTQNRVSMTTTINVVRTIEGTDLYGLDVRNAFFTCLSGDGSVASVTYTEHFVKIAGGTRLLHYSDEYEAFEIFTLPNNWFIENGVAEETVGCPKVFESISEIQDDKDFEEISEILKTRKISTTDKVYSLEYPQQN